MEHFEVICPVCAGGLNDPRCPFQCSGGVQPRIESAEGLRFFFTVTCRDCQWRHECEYAWDPYNTNGDCLEMK